MSEQVQVSAVKEKSLRQYCSTWLNQKQDRFFDYWEKNWAKLFADHPLLSKSRLRDEIDKLRGYIFINPIIQTGRWTVDVPEIARSAAHFGMFNAFPDGDGVIRRSPLFYRAGARQEDLIPSLALQTYLISTGYQAYLTLDQDLSDPLKRYENQQFAVSKLEIRDPEKDETKFQIPVDHRGRLLINYAGPQMAFPHLPASELFHDRPQIKIYETTYDEKSKRYLSLEKLVDRQDFIKDRLFLVGATATAVYDLRVTPFEEGYPGVETHANILANLMSQNFLRSHPQESLWMILAVIVLGIGTSLLIHYQGPVAGLITTAILVGGVLVIDRHFLFGRGILAATIFLVIEIGLIYVSMTFFKYFIEERKKKYLKATFAKYVF